jgi:endonuclease/exonuclease/phosphatase family metal-dependent hydrolase
MDWSLRGIGTVRVRQRRTPIRACLLIGILGMQLALGGCCLHTTKVVSNASLPVDAAARPTVEVISFNVQLLPPPLSKDRPVRVKKIVEAVGDAEIVALSEAFGGSLGQDQVKQQLISGLEDLGFAVATEPTGQNPPLLFDSGLVLASRYPIKDWAILPFRCCFQLDCLASKAAIIATLEVSAGRLLRVLVTHLQSWAPNLGTRKSQVEQIVSFISTRFDPTVPLLAMGDFNIRGPQKPAQPYEEEYNSLLSALGNPTDVFLAIHKAVPTNGKKRIDFVFCRGCETLWEPDAGQSSVRTISYQPKKNKWESVSDHRALDVHFTLRPESP